MKLSLPKNRIKKLNNALFWRCYAIDRKISRFREKSVRCMSIDVASRLVLIFALLITAAVPQVVSSRKNEVTSEVAGESVQDVYAMGAMILDLPASPDRPKRIKRVTVTFYSSDSWQTDDTPFITANGTRVHDGIVATNALPFGTVVKLPEIYGDKMFTVEDRMHKRYRSRVDVWVEHRDEAFARGIVRNTLFEIYE